MVSRSICILIVVLTSINSSAEDVVYYSPSRRLPGIQYVDGITYEDEMEEIRRRNTPGTDEYEDCQVKRFQIIASDNKIAEMMVNGTDAYQRNLKLAILRCDREAFLKGFKIWDGYVNGKDGGSEIRRVLDLAAGSKSKEGERIRAVCVSWLNGSVWSSLSIRNANGEIVTGDQFYAQIYRDEQGRHYESRARIALQHAGQKTIIKQDRQKASSGGYQSCDDLDNLCKELEVECGGRK